MINDTNELRIKGELLMLCGCLHDIAEKLKNDTAKKQIEDVEKRLENIVDKNFIYHDQKRF